MQMSDDIYFDTDCLSSFLWINNTSILEKLYCDRIVIPEPVYIELSNPCVPHLRQQTDQLLNDHIAKRCDLLCDTQEYELYRKLINNPKICIGKGEAAGIALAKTHNGVLASNNYKDISNYVEQYNLKHLDTGLILKEALKKELITESTGNRMWTSMKLRKRKLPYQTFTEFLKNNRQ